MLFVHGIDIVNESLIRINSNSNYRDKMLETVGVILEKTKTKERKCDFTILREELII